MSTVLFICTGNLCRSPTASALLASRLASADSDICVDSAGLLDLGAQSPPEVITAGLPLGVDLSGHRGRQVTPADIRGADLILGMTRGHVREVVTMDPGAWSRTFTLPEIVRRGRAVGPRGVGQSLDEWLIFVHQGRRTVDLQGKSAKDDIDDPLGGSARKYRASAESIAGLVDELARLVWPDPTGPDRQ